MLITHTIKIDQTRNGDGSMTYGARVTEHHTEGDYTSFYTSRDLAAAYEMAHGLAAILKRNSSKAVKIAMQDMAGQPIPQENAA